MQRREQSHLCSWVYRDMTVRDIKNRQLVLFATEEDINFLFNYNLPTSQRLNVFKPAFDMEIWHEA